jgi:chromosomal replication initiation ATPase DnaA
VGSANREMLRFLRLPMNWKTPITLIVGPIGTGKSHIGNAWANETGFLFLDDASQIDEEILFFQLNLILNGTGSRLLMADKNFPKKWSIKMPDLISRLKSITLVELTEHDDEVLEMIVRGIFEAKGRNVSRDLISYLLKHYERSVPAQVRIAEILEKAAQSQKADLSKSFAMKFLKTNYASIPS